MQPLFPAGFRRPDSTLAKVEPKGYTFPLCRMDPRPDKEDPPKKPPSRDLADLDPSEREFWDSDDQDDLEDPPPHPPEKDLGDLDVLPAKGQVPHEDAAPETHDPLDEELDDLELADDEQDDHLAAAAEDSAPAEPAPPADQDSDQSDEEQAARRFSRNDFIWIGVLGIFVVTIMVYAISLFFKNVQTSGGPDNVKFPVKGERVVIGKIDSFWRKPDRAVDRVSLDAELIPCADLTLKSGSGAARLRIFFEDDSGEFVGDPVTLTVSDGTFASTGSNQISVHGTEGLEHEGQYAAYLTAEFKFWYINVFEGPPSDADLDEFTKITRVRISPKRR